MFAPYKVATFNDIPAAYTDPDGKWVNDYGGYMSIGFDSTKVPPVADINDLLKPEYNGKVALNGDPTQAGAAFSGVLMVALSQGGSVDDIAPGVEFFRKLKESGNFLPVDPTPATIESGQTPVVIDWNYLNAARDQRSCRAGRCSCRRTRSSPATTTRRSTRTRRIPPPPGCGRSSSTATRARTSTPQAGSGRCAPTACFGAGTIDKAVIDHIPVIDGPVTVPTPDQTEKATKYLTDNWAKAIG